MLKRLNSEGKPYAGPLLIMASGQEVKPEKEMDIIVEHPSGATAKASVAVLYLTGDHLLLGNDILRQFHKITVEYKEEYTATLLLNIQVKNSPETANTATYRKRSVPSTGSLDQSCSHLLDQQIKYSGHD